MILDVGGERCELAEHGVDDDLGDHGELAEHALEHGVDDDPGDHGELGVNDYDIMAMLATLNGI